MGVVWSQCHSGVWVGFDEVRNSYFQGSFGSRTGRLDKKGTEKRPRPKCVRRGGGTFPEPGVGERKSETREGWVYEVGSRV